MLWYIDPGTGSMLFAILIGIFGALSYVLRGWVVKLRFRLSGGEKVEANSDKLPLVIFSDSKRYWNIFMPICRELGKRGMAVTYYTASPDDPALEADIPGLHAEFIGEGNRAFARLNFLRAGIVFSTTPGLDVYQWKRSKDVDMYIHIPHMANDITTYRMFGIDYYDAVMVSGDHQRQDIRALEKLRGLKEKEIVDIGIPYMDEMKRRLDSEGRAAPHERTVLLAPSWGESAILKRFGEGILQVLLDTGYHIIVRPHPQSFSSEKDMLDALMKKFPDSERLEWNRDNDNFDVLNRSDILISDFSGVIFDFSLVYDKPVIYADTDMDLAPYDAWWLDKELWTFSVLPRIGQKLSRDNFEDLKTIIDTCIDDPRFAEGRRQAREETWLNPGHGAEKAAGYLMECCEALSRRRNEVEG